MRISSEYNLQTNSTVSNQHLDLYRNSDIWIFDFVKFDTNILKYFQIDTKKSVVVYTIVYPANDVT